MKGGEIPTIGVKDIPRYQSRRDVRFIDVREQREYEIDHIPGAINLPYDEIEEWERQLGKDKTYVLYCERGSTSMIAAKQLLNQGYKVYTLVGGIKALQKKNLD